MFEKEVDILRDAPQLSDLAASVTSNQRAQAYVDSLHSGDNGQTKVLKPASIDLQDDRSEPPDVLSDKGSSSSQSSVKSGVHDSTVHKQLNPTAKPFTPPSYPWKQRKLLTFLPSIL